jgi:hypothetical protein
VSGLVGAAVARLEEFLLEPAEADGTRAEPTPLVAPGPRPVIAVIGLARRCGATVVARALGAELAARDPGGAGAVASGAAAGSIPLATTAARRLAQALADVPGATTSAVGRLCLVEGADHAALADSSRHLAPLVLDPGSAELESAEAAVADRVLLVTTPRVERALGAAAVSCLRRIGTEPILVQNMSRGGAWAAAASERPHAGPASELSHAAPGNGLPHAAPVSELPHAAPVSELPHSRAGAQLALGGRQPRGDLGRAVAALADLCERLA